MLGHPVRIRMLEILSSGERTVGDLQAELNLDSSGTSQHLTALRQHGVLESRRAGTSVYYRIRDPRVTQLLAVAKEILTSALSDSHALLSDLADEPTPHPSDASRAGHLDRAGPRPTQRPHGRRRTVRHARPTGPAGSSGISLQQCLWTAACLSELESGGGGHHGGSPGMNGGDDFFGVDALKVDAGGAEVGVSELALDHVERHAFTGEFDGVGVA